MANGILRIQSFGARQSTPVPQVTVVITGPDFETTLITDDEGNAADLEIAAPACRYSLDENNTTVTPYSTVNLYAYREGYRPVEIQGVQIFAGQVTLAALEMIPAEGDVQPIADDPVIIPVHSLFAGTGGSGPAPAELCEGDWVLNQVVIPTNITVHLGKPAASARNVTVSFRDYIANVASSEVYPTWPEQALRANIHAQISLALNRIYTEWYPSKGYTFNITNSTSYDQYYVHGRTVFDVMVRITDDIFNTYLRKRGTVNPYYAEYCDGKSVSCPGMKQWGTVTLANQGRNALQILQNYYGSDIEIVRTSNIQAIPESYPGTPLREGNSGTNVFILQRQLNRITKDYPFFGLLNVDGVFSPEMTRTVQRFQQQFGLTADGVVGRQTWYKISYIYVSVKDLAELTSEGETSSGNLSDGTWGGVILRRGSTGTAVEQLQYWLNVLSDFYSDLPSLTVDGSFGAATEAAVRAFQTRFDLTVDGIVGEVTWTEIFEQYQSIQTDISPGQPSQYPGSPLQQGDRGSNVMLVQFWLKIARSVYSALPDLTVDGVFGAGTRAAVVAFQTYFDLTADGVVGQATWNKLHEVYNGIANDLLSPDLRPGEYPGVLRRGSSGTAVRELQFYLYLAATFDSSLPTVTIDGSFGAATEAAVRAFQQTAGLTVDGIVGRATWDALYALASRLRQSGSVITVTRLPYPGQPLTLGSTGEAVRYYSSLIQRIAFYYDTVQAGGVTDFFDDSLQIATPSFQQLAQLPVTGVVDAETWLAAELLSLALLAQAWPLRADNDDPYPGFAIGEGSAGPQVRQAQRWLNSFAAQYCPESHVEEDGSYENDENDATRSFQNRYSLPETGIIELETLNQLRSIALRLDQITEEGGTLCGPCFNL